MAYDIRPNEELKELGVEYVSMDELMEVADVVSLHCPLLPSTFHIIDAKRCPPFISERTGIGKGDVTGWN